MMVSPFPFTLRYLKMGLGPNTKLLPAKFVAEDREKELYMTKDSNCLIVSVSYYKGRGVYLNVQPAKSEDGPYGKIVSTMLMSGKTVCIDNSMKRDNKKKVTAIFDAVCKAIENKSGEPYALVVKVLADYGMELIAAIQRPGDAWLYG